MRMISRRFLINEEQFRALSLGKASQERCGFLSPPSCEGRSDEVFILKRRTGNPLGRLLWGDYRETLILRHWEGLAYEERVLEMKGGPGGGDSPLWASDSPWLAVLPRQIFPLPSDSGCVIRYGGAAKGLLIFEKLFSERSRARNYEPEIPVVAEVSFDPRYRESALAVMTGETRRALGPDFLEDKSSVGVLPYHGKSKHPKVVMVTNKKGDAWIFPKGQREDNLSVREAALQEALEEAGLHGSIVGQPVVVPYVKENKTASVFLFPMRIEEKKKRWDEDSQRERASVKLERARSFANNSLAQYGLNYLEFFLNLSEKEAAEPIVAKGGCP